MDDNLSIIIIVEGHGEVKAAPGLIRRILGDRLGRYDIPHIRTIRANGKPDLVKRLETHLRRAAVRRPDAILVLVDADDECPVEVAGGLVGRASALSLGVPVAMVYAKSEYETWIICSLSEDAGERIRERLDIAPSVNAPEDAENIRGAKEWLRRRGRGYRETEDQEPLTHHIDLDRVHCRSRSFQRLCHAVEELVRAIDGAEVVVTPMLGGDG